MIESNIIEWLDFGDSIQNIYIYSRKYLIILFNFFRTLNKNKSFPIIIYIILILLFFIQLWIMFCILVPIEGDIILEILDYLKNVILPNYIITDKSNYELIF